MFDYTASFMAADYARSMAYEAAERAERAAEAAYGEDWQTASLPREEARYVSESDVNGGEPDPCDVDYDAWHDSLSFLA